MKQEIKIIIPGYGLGILKFGLTRDEIKKILGEPDEIDKDSYTESDEDLTESWHYDDLELSLSFDEEDDWRLVTFSVSSEFYEFEKLNVIGMEKALFLSELNKLEIKDLEYEDCSSIENPSHELYSSDKLGINFWLDDNIVEEIQWSPLFTDDDSIDWPK